MKKINLLWTILAVVCSTFISCDKDDDNIDDNNGNGKMNDVQVSGFTSVSNLDEVGAYIEYGRNKKYEIYRIPYTNSFTIELPNTLDSEYLLSVKSFSGSQEYSDEETMISSYVVIAGYDSKGKELDKFTCFFTNNGRGMIRYMYADRDCTVKGLEFSGADGHQVNLSLKKGWNRVISSNADASSPTIVTTGKMPDGAKWYYAW